jgi:putative tryptophan/tyrosine transport system substrate-binding protein
VNRREFVVGLGAGLAAPLTVDAQPALKVSRLGMLGMASWERMRTAPSALAFIKRMSELGWIDGQNLTIDFQGADGKIDRLSGLAADLATKVDVIVAWGNELTLRAAKQATSAIPIVAIAIDYDPLARGYVNSLARPANNITGVFLRQPELTPKRLELLRETLPKATRIAVFWDALSTDQLTVANQAASSLRIELRPIELRDPAYDVDGALREAAKLRASAVLILASTFVYRDRDRIAQLALAHRVATMSAYGQYAEAGGLMTYGAHLPAMSARAAEYVNKILRGSKPGDLPLEQPTKFELVINLKTAKALGLTIPPSLLLRTDQVID